MQPQWLKRYNTLQSLNNNTSKMQNIINVQYGTKGFYNVKRRPVEFNKNM